MNNLEMLTAREQLMEDIDCIISSNFDEFEYKDDVIKQLCDAVCKSFPISNDETVSLLCFYPRRVSSLQAA